MVSEKSGSHSSSSHSPSAESDVSVEELKQIYARAASQKFNEVPRYPTSATAGVMPMSITGRFDNERERLGPDFNEKERQWRLKWIKDQELHPMEPFEVKQLYYEYHNPLRRFYRKPLDLLEDAIAKYSNRNKARITRQMIGRGFLGYLSFLAVYYWIKYNGSNWEKERGVKIIPQREMVLPGDVRFPRPNPKTESWQYFDRGFHKRKVFLNDE